MGMVSKKMGEEEIKTMFSQFGPIEDCTVLRDDNGVSRGGRRLELATFFIIPEKVPTRAFSWLKGHKGCPRRGLYRDCEILANLRLKLRKI